MELSGILPEVQMGLASLFAHKLRSLLTALGIIIGVLAVIVMVAIGEGAKKAALEQLQGLAPNGNQGVRLQETSQPGRVFPVRRRLQTMHFLARHLVDQPERHLALLVGLGFDKEHLVAVARFPA